MILRQECSEIKACAKIRIVCSKLIFSFISTSARRTVASISHKYGGCSRLEIRLRRILRLIADAASSGWVWRSWNAFCESYQTMTKNLNLYWHIHKRSCLKKSLTSKSRLSIWKIRRRYQSPWGRISFVNWLYVIAVAKRSTDGTSRWRSGDSFEFRTYFWIWRSSRCILLPTPDVAMTDDTYRVPPPASPHKSQLLYLSLSAPDPQAHVKTRSLIWSVEKSYRRLSAREQRACMDLGSTDSRSRKESMGCKATNYDHGIHGRVLS